MTRLWHWLIGTSPEATYVEQVQTWGASEPFITPLDLPAVRDIRTTVKRRRKRKAQPVVQIRRQG